MLDLGWQELMMVAFVLVLVVGPKDLPRVLRGVAKFVGKARGMASEFQSSMMEVANQDEFRDVKKALQDAKSGNFDDVASGFEDVKGAVDEISKDAEISGSVESIKDTARDIKAETDKAAAPTAAPAETKPKTISKAAKKTVKKTAAKSSKKSAGKAKS